MDYSTYLRPELLKLCKERGLSTAGTTEDLIDRLTAQDAEAGPDDADFDPLADVDESDKITEVEPASAPAPAETSSPAAPDPAPATELSDKNGAVGKMFRREYRLDRPVDDNYHRFLLGETHAAAHAAGYATKGAPLAGHRVRYDQDADGRLTVVYEVYVRRS